MNISQVKHWENKKKCIV